MFILVEPKYRAGASLPPTSSIPLKSGDDYIRIATNVSTRIGRRGLGTILTGAALKSIKEGNPYYGKTSILGTPYVSGYEPIKDASGATIGVYFVGYTK